MKVRTTRFGELEVDEEAIIRFPEGIPGFAEMKRFVLVPHPGGGPFMWLQSADSPELAFAVLEPSTFRPDYEVVLGAEEAAAIELTDEADALVLVITGFGKDGAAVTANLAAPLVINRRARLGKQFILEREDYGLRHDVLEEMVAAARAAVARARGR